ncbi:N-acetylglucosaminyldiphosphodolichol N-acetylglucosaminyltransferase anchoring subunit [Saccharomycopsis crataegensis]|uniref:UDP-N-acetylglucosamine transferase subunit ALG14 n=1 Tax=Saccharomycopsis crataegensis TaxID=43959 RepID=A0AAV5QG19_9ASCO|nr:N-acetylglucosaminyldiphosphodolichol N-acetylglucosaminyltransferase anchoring subunit [Saccharomycopsis crataegensis]
MVLLGSGGHTGEMIRLLDGLDFTEYSRLTLVITEGDNGSIKKARDFENSNFSSNEEVIISEHEASMTSVGNFVVDYIFLPRARNVGQPLISSAITTIGCIVQTFKIMWSRNTFPHAILCNGPGTSVPLCYVFYLLSLVKFQNAVIIYVESLARVSRLSASGWLLYPIASRFIVQWEMLHEKFSRSEYYGILV